jgi:CheY-like chemotaxis protein
MTQAKKKILLVDDSSTALMIEQMLLGSAYALSTARDGREALTKAASEQPDLILMDVIMPHMTGIEACRALREQESTRKIPVILVTTRGEAENVERGWSSGCNDYVTKPINGLELLTKIRNQLGE